MLSLNLSTSTTTLQTTQYQTSIDIMKTVKIGDDVVGQMAVGLQ